VTTIVIGDAATVFTDAVALAGGGPELADSTIHALLDANAVAIAAIGLPMALFAFAASAVVWATGVLPRWLAVIGSIAGVLHLAGALCNWRRLPRVLGGLFSGDWRMTYGVPQIHLVFRGYAAVPRK
jgi:hypothetical protein